MLLGDDALGLVNVEFTQFAAVLTLTHALGGAVGLALTIRLLLPLQVVWLGLGRYFRDVRFVFAHVDTVSPSSTRTMEMRDRPFCVGLLERPAL